ncbi:helix-turn-helix transcriptional regulator [Arthrobacter zhaoguopingii]|uniref:helix-turn-helix transcriptional regulator n=1 Tax=Arthrobacter zhaoguopingii TaxID=2681491 RepID=UPI00135B4502|nr:helix-turn-helix domain-containing protein [Arthrobacter zhaoguopingii]
MTSELLTPAELADRLSTSVAQLANWRYQGTGPRFIKTGAKLVRYRAVDVEAWLDAQTRQQSGTPVSA